MFWSLNCQVMKWGQLEDSGFNANIKLHQASPKCKNNPPPVQLRTGLPLARLLLENYNWEEAPGVAPARIPKERAGSPLGSLAKAEINQRFLKKQLSQTYFMYEFPLGEKKKPPTTQKRN